MNNIINTYLAYLDYQDKTRPEGVAEINKAIGSNHSPNYLSHLKSGKHKNTSTKIHNYLWKECCDFRCKQVGYRDLEKFRMAVEGLMPGDRK